MDEALPSDVQVLAQGTGIALPGQVFGRVITFVGLTILARWLGPPAFGLYAIGWTMLKVGSTVASFGLPVGVVRLGSQERGRNPARFRGVVLQSLGSALGIGALLGLGLYLAAPWLAGTVFNNPNLVVVLRLFAPAMALAAGLHVAAAATRITQKVHFSILATELMQPGLYLILSVAALVFGGGLQGAILAALTSYAVAFLAAVVFMVRLFPEVKAVRSGVESALGKLLPIAIPVSLAVTFATVTVWVDRLIIGAFRPMASVGVYQAVSQASTLFAVILASVSLTFGPMVANLSLDRDRSRMLELFRVSTKWTVYVSLPILLVVWFAAPEIVRALYGPAYVLGAQALILLTVGQILNAATGPTGPFLNMTGHHLTWFRLSGLALITNVILGLTLVPRWGLEGAAVSTAISLGSLSLASLVASKRILGAWPYDRRFTKVLVAALATVAFLGIMEAVLPLHGALKVALMAAGALAVFTGVVGGLGLDPEDRAFFRTVGQVVGLGAEASRRPTLNRAQVKTWTGDAANSSKRPPSGDSGQSDGSLT